MRKTVLASMNIGNRLRKAVYEKLYRMAIWIRLIDKSPLEPSVTLRSLKLTFNCHMHVAEWIKNRPNLKDKIIFFVHEDENVQTISDVFHSILVDEHDNILVDTFKAEYDPICGILFNSTANQGRGIESIKTGRYKKVYSITVEKFFDFIDEIKDPL